MQIRQLESLQAMAKTSGSKVIFVPMNLSDLNSPSGRKQLAQEDASASGSGAAMQLSDVSQLTQMSQL